MRAAERGFRLLTSHLGDPDCKVLTAAQFRSLTNRARQMERLSEQRELMEEDLISLGYDRASARNILYLLSREEQLDYYLNQAKRADCTPISRNSDRYPGLLHCRLGADSPGCLWAKGDRSLLEKEAVALVGSRELLEENREFAFRVGKEAAEQGYVLVSGNARGADRTAQESCLEHGGQVISVVADSLEKHKEQPSVLFLSEDGFDMAFSAQRAHSRNRVIHALGKMTFVAQCTYGSGGTWKGTAQNLRQGWSPVFCYNDGTPAMAELSQMGAVLIDTWELSDFSTLKANNITFMN